MSEKDLHTIEEVFELPSQGLIYERPINPKIKLRAMTAQDEMLRLAPSEDRYKVLTDLIDNCIVGDKPDISTYDMCMGDYTYLLHALRIVTYGVDYPVGLTCMTCGNSFMPIIKLDQITVRKWYDSFPELFTATLPHSGKVVELKYQTPRMMDDVARRVKQLKKSNPDLVEDMENNIQKIVYAIKTVDGKKVNPVELEAQVRKMNMADFNYINQTIDLISDSLGPLGLIQEECPECHNMTLGLFRYSSEFFRPSVR